MATKNTSSNISSTASTLESMDILSSSTLKRNPKMELSKADLLKLLSYLEGELQAREVVIATLKAEKVKQLLQHVKFGGYNMENPMIALQRDAFAACSPGFDEMAVQAIYSNQLLALETLIDAQRCAHYQMKEQMVKIEQHHEKVLQELDEERCKYAQDTAQGDDVTYLLEKERGRLKQEIELERQHNKKLEKEFKKLASILDQERSKQKQIVLLLLSERQQIIVKLLEERQHCIELEKVLQLQKGRLADAADGLEEESQKSLQMEAELEQQLAIFADERNRLKEAITVESNKSARLQDVNHSLVLEVASLKQKTFSNPIVIQDTGTFVPNTPNRPSVGSTSKQAGPPIPPTKPNHATKSKLVSPVASSSTSLPTSNNCQKEVAHRNQVNLAGTPPLKQELADNKVTEAKNKRSDKCSSMPQAEDMIVCSTASVGLSATSKPVAKLVHSIASAPNTKEVSSEKPTSVTCSAADKLTPNSVDSNSNSISNKILTFGGKGSATKSTTGQQPPQPPKKPVAIVRGTPPPVPPNKPILLAQARRLSMDSTEVDTKLIKPANKEKIGSQRSEPQDTTKPAVKDGGQVGLLLPPTSSMDLLGQELADFQQLLVSMVNGEGIEMLTPEHISLETSQDTS